MAFLSYFSQMSRNLEAPGFMKDFEEVLNQVQNLIAVEYNYVSNNNNYAL